MEQFKVTISNQEELHQYITELFDSFIKEVEESDLFEMLSHQINTCYPDVNGPVTKEMLADKFQEILPAYRKVLENSLILDDKTSENFSKPHIALRLSYLGMMMAGMDYISTALHPEGHINREVTLIVNTCFVAPKKGLLAQLNKELVS